MGQKGRRLIGMEYFDYTLVFIIVFLVGFGLVMLYSTSSYNAQLKFKDSAYYLKKQLFASLLGFAGMFLMAHINYHVWQHLSGMMYLGAMGLCIAVIFVGSNLNGSTRWLKIGPLSFQPSEIAKLAVILFLATMINRIPKQMGKFRTVVKVIVVVLPIFAIVAYSNLSTAIIILGIAICLIFVASPKYLQFIVMGGLVLVSGAIFIAMASYRAERLKIWLPEEHNDFIFAIICEELGLFGAICVVLLFLLLIWRFLVIANNASDLFGALIVVGIMAHIAIQVILNIAVVTNTIPNTGITLPFISYGGTSVAILLTEMGLALSVSRGIRLEKV